MPARRVLRLIHLLSTIWFSACIAYILVCVLRQVGFRWWIIFSLSGPYALVIFLSVSLYLFALYRGIGEAQQIEVEHPLTTTGYYMTLYVAAPLMGGLAGVLGMLEVTQVDQFLLGVALGTLFTTFCIWVVIDPIAGVLETFLPASRQHRTERLAQAEALRRARQEKRECLLAEALAREERERRHWEQKLQPQAQRLAALLACDANNRIRAEQEAVDIGAQAWQLGGLTCMRQLHDMALRAAQGTGPRVEDTGQAANDSVAFRSASSVSCGTVCDYLSYWWDGIGDWRRPASC